MRDNARNHALHEIESSPDALSSPPEVVAFTKRQKVATVAEKLLTGNISVIEAARQISVCRDKSFGLDESDPDFVTFLAIDRETDHRLFVESLQNWARPYALARKDAEVARCEEADRSGALGAAGALLRGSQRRPDKANHVGNLKEP